MLGLGESEICTGVPTGLLFAAGIGPRILNGYETGRATGVIEPFARLRFVVERALTK